MEKLGIEFSDKRETRNYAHQFVRRLNEAKQKGFKITGPIGEKELRSFEQSGFKAPEVKEKRSIELTPEDRKRIRKRLNDESELEQYRKDMKPVRDQRRREIENELKIKKLGSFMAPDDKNYKLIFVAMPKVEGYAMIWNSRSVDLGGFVETIKPEAMNGIINKSDVLCLLDHNKDRGLLARATQGTGSLKLEVDNKGLKYTFESPDTSLGKEVTEGIKRGDIRTSSFAFTVSENGQRWTELSNGMYLREITQFTEIYDVSPVYREAYNATSVKIINT